MHTHLTLTLSPHTQITPETLVGDLVEEVATNKALPQDHYALYLVIGEGDSYRVLSGSDRLLGALSSVGSECYLCLKPNSFFVSLKPFVSLSFPLSLSLSLSHVYVSTCTQFLNELFEHCVCCCLHCLQMHLDSWDPVQVHVREKRKWKKYPCAIRGNSFVQFKDSKVWTHSHSHPHSHSHTHTHTHSHTHSVLMRWSDCQSQSWTCMLEWKGLSELTTGTQCPQGRH